MSTRVSRRVPAIHANYARVAERCVKDAFGIPATTRLSDRSKVWAVSEARCALYYLLRLTEMKPVRIAAVIGRTRPAISYGIKRCRNLMETELAYAAKVKKACVEFNAAMPF